MNKKLLVIPVIVLVLTMVLAVTGFACGECDCGCGPCPPPPCGGDEGRTPGYWKQPQHQGAWMYSTVADFDTTFGTNYFDPDITLLEALSARGHGSELYRHGVAALLNAASLDVDYGLTVAEVIAAVQEGNAWLLVQANEQFCPLGRAPAP